MLDALKAEGKDVIGVGKIYDIFEGQGVTETYPNQGNEKNMEKTLEIQKKEFDGLCYVNLVDGDMIYGHRRDIAGYAGICIPEKVLQIWRRRLRKLLEVNTGEMGSHSGMK